MYTGGCGIGNGTGRSMYCGIGKTIGYGRSTVTGCWAQGTGIICCGSLPWGGGMFTFTCTCTGGGVLHEDGDAERAASGDGEGCDAALSGAWRPSILSLDTWAAGPAS